MAKAFKGEMFEKFPVQTLQKNTFTLDTQRLFTTNAGLIVPFCTFEVQPGEVFKVDLAAFVRMMPMVTPIMHQIDCFVHAFYVRNPIVWKQWADFIRGGDDGRTDIAPPNVGNSVSKDTFARFMVHELGGVTYDGVPDDAKGNLMCESSLMDYLGLPTVPKQTFRNHIVGQDDPNVASNYASESYVQPFTLFEFKGYQSIWNEYYRDEYIQDKVEIMEELGGDHLGPITTEIAGSPVTITPNWDKLRELFKLRYRAWEKDAFTSALQEPVAVPEVKIPMSADVEIFGRSDASFPFTAYSNQMVVSSENRIGLDEGSQQIAADGRRFFYNLPVYNGETELSGRLELNSVYAASTLRGEIAQVSATINQLRNAVALQEFYELSARAGNRYKEMLIAHFNTIVPDYTLDRPQYLGGTRWTMGISSVQQTSATQGDSSSADYQPLGQLAGEGMAGSGAFLFKEKFYEHGNVFLCFSIRPRSMYTSMLPKKFQRFDRRDYYWNKLAHIGDQEVKNKEVNFCLLGFTADPVYCTSNLPEQTFGYQTRYWEYKYLPNTVHGSFKTTLKDWHLGRFFYAAPKLNEDFIEVKGEQLNRAFAYTGDDYDHYLVQANVGITAVRPIPIFSIPKFT